ncbi:hypothetical protein DVH24_028501 [Malus domestica]|uniref:Uncharacterized protein n=1 Tax=Malus domestica TaxID=3750 RepID=A0A498J0C9_MALDO|nr:hypothetical protein DVH24_028501 [Malus domestica]
MTRRRGEGEVAPNFLAQAPTMAKQPAIRHTHVETTRATSQFKMATATTEGLIGDIPYQSAGNSALVHTRTKCRRQTTVETVGSSAPLVVLPSEISFNSNFANTPWRPPGMTSAISSNAKNPWRPSGISPMHNMQNQQVKKHRTLQKK